MEIQFVLTLISGILVAGASGLVGSFLVLRKMTLLSDALSHVALPGIAIGVLLKFEPLIGGLLFLFFGILLIWGIEYKTRLAIESITGVLFVTALAVGSVLMPQSEILETFFGSVEKITISEIILQSALAIFVIVMAARYLKSLIITSIAPDLGAADGISQAKMELLLLVLIALTITIGISFVGILLMSALSIIPAAAARNFSKNYKTFLGLSVVLAIISLSGGLILNQVWNIGPGIATVLISAFIFVVSLFAKTRS